MNNKQVPICPECKQAMKKAMIQIVHTPTQPTGSVFPIARSQKFISYVCMKCGRMQSIEKIK